MVVIVDDAGIACGSDCSSEIVQRKRRIILALSLSPLLDTVSDGFDQHEPSCDAGNHTDNEGIICQSVRLIVVGILFGDESTICWRGRNIVWSQANLKRAALHQPSVSLPLVKLQIRRSVMPWRQFDLNQLTGQ